jgi:hypothetical protein
VVDSEDVISGASYYQRAPSCRVNEQHSPARTLAGWKSRCSPPVCDNHLVTCAEVLAMYLLIWSPVSLDPAQDRNA